MAEIVKLAVICDAQLFDLLESFGRAGLESAFQDPCGKEILDRSIGTMLVELEPNLYEDELARKVDFGHTFSYGLETLHGDRLLHGEAVLLDILVSVVIARERKLITPIAAKRVFELVEALGLEPAIEWLDADCMWRALGDRIEHRNGRQRVPLPTAIGQCAFFDDISYDEFGKCIHILRQGTSEHGSNRASFVQC
jgi:3-dehydroquinate synthase